MLYDFPFTLGFEFPFTPLVRNFLKTHKVSIGMLIPNCSKIFACLELLRKELGLKFSAKDVHSLLKFRILTKGRLILRSEGALSLILKLNETVERG